MTKPEAANARRYEDIFERYIYFQMERFILILKNYTRKKRKILFLRVYYCRKSLKR